MSWEYVTHLTFTGLKSVTELKPVFVGQFLQSQEYLVRTNVKLPLTNGNV